METILGLAIAMAALSMPAATSAPAPHREALMPAKTASRKRVVHKRKNTTPANRYRSGRGSKLWRRLRRKHQLGMNGAY